MLKYIPSYFIVSVFALGVDYLLMRLMYEVYHIPILYAAAAGYMLGAVVHYAGSVLWVFDYRRFLDAKKKELSLFLASGLVGIVITEIVMYTGVEALSADITLTKIAAAGVSFISIYLLRYRFLFFKSA